MAHTASKNSKGDWHRFSTTSIAVATIAFIGAIVLIGLLLTETLPPPKIPTPAPVSFDRAEELYRQGNHEQVIPALEGYLERTVESDPSVPVARDLLVSSYWNTGDHQAAFDLLKKIVAVKPHDTDSIYRMGLLASEMNQSKTAIEYFAQATTDRSGQPQYHTGYAEALTKSGQKAEAKEQWEIVLSLIPGDSPTRADIQAKIAAVSQ